MGCCGLFSWLVGLWALVRSLGLVGACAGLAAFAGLGRLCALAGGRFCWACGRVWAAVGGRLLALLLGLVGACGRLGGRFCWAQHLWVGAFAGLLLLAIAGIVGLGFGRFCWLVGACWRLRALLGAFARLAGLVGVAGLGSCGCFCCLGALVGAFAGLVVVGVCRRFCRACGRLWALLTLWALSLACNCRRLVGACGLSWGCGRFRWACGRFCWACERLRALAGGRCLKKVNCFKTMRVPPDDRKPRPKANVSELLVKDALLTLNPGCRWACGRFCWACGRLLTYNACGRFCGLLRAFAGLVGAWALVRALAGLVGAFAFCWACGRLWALLLGWPLWALLGARGLLLGLWALLLCCSFWVCGHCGVSVAPLAELFKVPACRKCTTGAPVVKSSLQR